VVDSRKSSTAVLFLGSFVLLLVVVALLAAAPVTLGSIIVHPMAVSGPQMAPKCKNRYLQRQMNEDVNNIVSSAMSVKSCN